MDKAGSIAGCLIAGTVLGYNWPKIKALTAPMGTTVATEVSGVILSGLKYVIEKKETLEDQLAERRVQKKPESVN